MSNSILQDLLIEYDKKKSNAERKADLNMQFLFEKYPELTNISNMINMVGV